MSKGFEPLEFTMTCQKEAPKSKEIVIVMINADSLRSQIIGPWRGTGSCSKARFTPGRLCG